MKRSKRFQKLQNMPVNLDGVIEEWKEVGLVTMESSFDPAPQIAIENGIMVKMDGVLRDVAEAVQAIFAYLNLPEVTNEEVDAATYDYTSNFFSPLLGKSSLGNEILFPF